MNNFSDITPELRQEYARRGGIASGKARRKQRTIRQSVQAFLSAKVPQEVLDSIQLKVKDFPLDENSTIAETIAAIAVQKVLTEQDMNAVDKLFRWAGEDTIRVEATGDNKLNFTILTADPQTLQKALDK